MFLTLFSVADSKLAANPSLNRPIHDEQPYIQAVSLLVQGMEKGHMRQEPSFLPLQCLKPPSLPSSESARLVAIPAHDMWVKCCLNPICSAHMTLPGSEVPPEKEETDQKGFIPVLGSVSPGWLTTRSWVGSRIC